MVGEGRSRLALLLAMLALALFVVPVCEVPLVTGRALAVDCEGDECQSPPPPPEEVIPGTAIVEGPPNPPVKFPKQHRKHRHRSRR